MAELLEFLAVRKSLGKFVDTWGGIVNEICKWIAVRVIFRHVLECRWDSRYLERYAV